MTPEDWDVLFPPLMLRHVPAGAADWWRDRRADVYEDPVWGERLQAMQDAPIVGLGLEPMLPWTNTLGRGIGTAFNDVLNTFDPAPGAQDYMDVERNTEPYASPIEQIGGDLTRFGVLGTLGAGSAIAAGVPLAAAIPASALAEGYVWNPYDMMETSSEIYPFQWREHPLISPLVRTQEDTERERRMKMAADFGIMGAMGAGGLPGLLALSGYMGAPIASSMIVPSDYSGASDDALMAELEKYDEFSEPDPLLLEELDRRRPVYFGDAPFADRSQLERFGGAGEFDDYMADAGRSGNYAVLSDAVLQVLAGQFDDPWASRELARRGNRSARPEAFSDLATLYDVQPWVYETAARRDEERRADQ